MVAEVVEAADRPAGVEGRVGERQGLGLGVGQAAGHPGLAGQAVAERGPGDVDAVGDPVLGEQAEVRPVADPDLQDPREGGRIEVVEDLATGPGLAALESEEEPLPGAESGPSRAVIEGPGHPVPARQGGRSPRRSRPRSDRPDRNAGRYRPAVEPGGAVQAPPGPFVAGGPGRLGRSIGGRDGPGHDRHAFRVGGRGEAPGYHSVVLQSLPGSSAGCGPALHRPWFRPQNSVVRARGPARSIIQSNSRSGACRRNDIPIAVLAGEDAVPRPPERGLRQVSAGLLGLHHPDRLAEGRIGRQGGPDEPGAGRGDRHPSPLQGRPERLEVGREGRLRGRIRRHPRHPPEPRHARDAHDVARPPGDHPRQDGLDRAGHAHHVDLEHRPEPIQVEVGHPGQAADPRAGDQHIDRAQLRLQLADRRDQALAPSVTSAGAGSAVAPDEPRSAAAASSDSPRSGRSGRPGSPSRPGPTRWPGRSPARPRSAGRLAWSSQSPPGRDFGLVERFQERPERRREGRRVLLGGSVLRPGDQDPPAIGRCSAR